MAAKMKRLFYKLILTGVFALLAVLTVIGSTGMTSLALDQQVRCGLPEHTHTDACYLDGVLLCKQKAHTHSNNCYLVLLEDNDINWLVQTIADSDPKSLEGVLDSAMGQALILNSSLSDDTPPLSLTSQDISALNDTIAENGIEPAVVLNENLQADTYLSYTPSALAVGDGPTTSTRAVNFYILLDGEITLIGSDTLTNSSPDYLSYADTVAIYKDVTVTALTTSNINSTYYFRYNTNGSVSAAGDFSSNASYGSSQVRFGNSSNARYTLLTTRSGNYGRYTYTPVAFYTVTLDYSQADPTRSSQTVYVQSGQTSGLTLSDEYLWYDASGNPVIEMPGTITGTTTLYAHPKEYTAVFRDENGDQLGPSYTGTPVNGLLSVKLPSLEGTKREGWFWIQEGTDGSTYYESDGTQIVYINGNTTFVATPNEYTVTFVLDTGQTVTQTVKYRGQLTFDSLPEGWLWTDAEGIRYSPGDQTPLITSDVTFTAVSQTVNVHYDVNFPSGAVNQVDEVPAIYGTTSSTATDIAQGGKSLTIRDLTSRTARREISSSNKESVTYYFKGWTVPGTDVLIQPDVVLSWNDLAGYIDDNGEIHLEGVWVEGARLTSATFFVRFDSAAVDVGGNITSQPSENYTPEVFNTYVGGIDSSWSDSQIKQAYEIADTTADNSYTADQAIRALYGEKASGMWLYDFPSDDYIFSYLKEYLANNPGKSLTYEGEPVDPAQLNHDYYAIRWYVCKLEGSSWHIDGKVYKKEGVVTVDKVFGGDDTVLQTEKDGFYILAENGTLDADGNFVAYAPTDSKFKEYLLVVNQSGADALRSQYPDAQILIFDSETDSAHHYEWLIEGVELGEYWYIEEFPVQIPGYSCYAEYTVYDTDGMHTAIAEYGTRAQMIGKTFALDEDPDQGLMVEFRNYYYPVETIIIKKEDGKTGKPIGGAVFELWQNGNRLSFNYSEDTGQYERDESGNGTFTQIVTTDDGFSVISTTGFSYDYGDVIIKEVLPPGGYDPAPDITVGLDDTGQVVIKDIAGKPPDEWASIAEVPHEDILVVKDYAAEFMSVTVEKVWNTNTPADSVVVVLQANGQHAAALFPGMTNAQVTLNAGNLWQHTWTDLPRYANGQLVQWGVKEIVIGGKPTLADGVSFANWTVTYSPGLGTDADGDGDVDNLKFIVTNSQKRLQLIITKVGTDGLILPGSIFSLEQVELVDGVWQPVAGTGANTQTTGANGMLTFDNLTADVYYRLTEVQATSGYYITFNPVVITMDGDGNIRRVLDDGTLAELYDPVIQITGPFNIRVVNLQTTELPETGGIGTYVYMQSGLLLMLLSAAALLLYKRKRRKEASDSS